MTSAAVNNTAAGKAPLNNKTLGIGMVAFACYVFPGNEAAVHQPGIQPVQSI